ncbi:hypothetical protein Pla52o_15170 [Novipirellula galeiformis]|uniref:Uncharacterized protein n=1 Tax=Novipirellula galeiformis TaxID=2528004 RepID=A0A5C6CQU9_9BACT|nr:hypothetical protein [Novipirellula galeiformis]TWU25219.1 hypothetical protein Pla52o_15170 [Novipirellula galeiformis]
MKKKNMIIARQKLLKFALVLVGLGLVFYFGARTLESYRQLRFIQEQGFDTGDADVNAIHPWMTIHFIAAAYAVPQEYIYAELGVNANERRRNIDVKHLNEELRLGPSETGDYPAVIDRLRQIILAYHENPVATGLSDVRPWMTLEYIANSSGIPTTTMVDELGLDEFAEQESPSNESASNAEVYIHKPLEELAHELRYPRGPRGLIEDIKAVITRQVQEVQ